MPHSILNERSSYCLQAHFRLTFDVLGSHLPLKQNSIIQTLTTLPEDGFSVTIFQKYLNGRALGSRG